MQGFRALVERAVVLHCDVRLEAAEPEGGSQGCDGRGARGVVARGPERAALHVGGQRQPPPVRQPEGVRRVELQVGEFVVAVAPVALVEDIVPAALGAEVQRVAVGERLAQGPLHDGVLVGLAVRGRPAQRAGRAAVRGVDVGLDHPFAAVQGAEDVITGTDLPEVVAAAACIPIAVREVPAREDAGCVGADGHPLRGLDVEAQGGHPGAEGAGLQGGAAGEGAVPEDRTRGAEGQAVLGIIDDGAAQRLER